MLRDIVGPLCLAGLSSFVCLTMTVSPPPAGPVAIVFNPFVPPDSNMIEVASAGGYFIQTLAGGRIIVADGNTGEFRRRISDTPGVLFLLDPGGTGLCRPIDQRI